MLWVCLLLPERPLEVAAASHAAPARAQALYDGPPRRPRVILANAAARQAGVRRGMPLAAAHALCPALQALARNLDAERQNLATLVGWAGGFSPQVAVTADGLLIEIGASLRILGGWPAVQRRMRGDLEALGHVHRLALAPGAAGAAVLARWRDGLYAHTPAQLLSLLDAAPLDCLCTDPASPGAAGTPARKGRRRRRDADQGLDAATLAVLRGMGLRRLGELFRLPRAELSRRVGAAAMDQLDRIRGLTGEALPIHRPAPHFRRRLCFEDAIDDLAALLFPLSRLIRELQAFLTSRAGGVQHFELELQHHARAPTRVRVGLLTPQDDAAALLECARGRLERLTLEAPVSALELRADELPPLRPAPRDLFDTARREALPWPALAERLRARLGENAVRGLACVPDHRPGRAWRYLSPQETGRADDHDGHVVDARQRPLWLLARPLPVPAHNLRILGGPERIESGWWDGHDQRRDYYRVATNRGQQAWAFHGIGANGTWMVHGWFA